MNLALNTSKGAVGLRIDGVKKWYGDVPAVRGVSLDIQPGEIVSFLGPSGCGKTTTLRMIAGLEDPDEGTIQIGGERINGVPPWKRNVGVVFQNYALFPHMTVAENVGFGLAMRRVAQTELKRRVDATMALVRLSTFGDRFPSQLSGGQRQRVALARAIVTEPSLLLLDEPLAALDKKLREQMQVEIKQLQRAVGITTVFVTHDQDEALSLSDRIVVMEEGRVVQVGTASDVYEKPQSRFVSDFIGVTNAVSGVVLSLDGGKGEVELASGQVIEVAGGDRTAIHEQVDLVIRPEKVSVSVQKPSGGVSVQGTLVHQVYSGSVTYYHVDLGQGHVLIAMAPNRSAGPIPAELGVRVWLSWDAASMMVFSRKP